MIILALIGGFFIGFFLCAILTAGKIADLESELMREKRIWKVLKMNDKEEDI